MSDGSEEPNMAGGGGGGVPSQVEKFSKIFDSNIRTDKLLFQQKQ